MHRTLCLTLVLTSLFSAPALAQKPTEPAQPTKQEKQDPTTPTPLTPEQQAQQRVAQLRAELQTLEKELAALRELKSEGGIVGVIRDELHSRTIKVPVKIEDPSGPVGPVVSAPTKPTSANRPVRPGASRRYARGMSPGEIDRQPEGVMATVDGLPITREEFVSHQRFLREYNETDTGEALRVIAFRNLLEAKVAAAVHGDMWKKAKDRALEMYKAVESGTPIEDVAAKMSDASEKGGDLGLITPTSVEPFLAQAAFRLDVDQVSGLVQTRQGFHIVKVTGKEGPKVRVTHLLARYGGKDDDRLEQAMARLDGGLCDIAFASAADMELAPPIYRR
jgi:hypothetical protein